MSVSTGHDMAAWALYNGIHLENIGVNRVSASQETVLLWGVSEMPSSLALFTIYPASFAQTFVTADL